MKKNILGGLSMKRFLFTLAALLLLASALNADDTLIYRKAAVGAETDPVVGAVDGIVKADGAGNVAAAEAGDFPTLNQNTTGTAAGLSGTPALPNGTTATTQSAADNSTKVATTAYVDTGLAACGAFYGPDPASPHYTQATLTMDNAWHDLDLSSIAPSGAKAVILFCSAQDGTVGANLQFRKNGQTNANNISGISIVVANQYHYITCIIFCDTSRVIEYKISETFSNINLTICGWLI